MITRSLEEAKWKIDNLEQSLKQARKENLHLRKRVENAHPYHRNTTARIMRRALDDATAIMVLRGSGFPTTRRYLYSTGMSERRYGWALGLLRSSRVVSPRGAAWWTEDTNEAYQKIKTSYDNIKEMPNALEMLRLYMSKSLQRAYRGKNG